MNIVITIIPIFAVIGIGWGARLRGLIPAEFFAPANRLVFYLAIPAMVFSAIAKSSLQSQFNLSVLIITLGCIVIILGAAWVVAGLSRMEWGRRGTFIQNSFHGNQGYIGLAVAYYYLGSDGLARASILMGFMMILNNFLGVIILQIHSDTGGIGNNTRRLAFSILKNPLILSALAGIAFAVADIRIPTVVDRCLAILTGMALPLALLIIGGSLSFELLKSRLFPVLWACGLKLLLMPAVGFTLYLLLGLEARDFLPGLILLATPTATVTYVMAREMKGDPALSVVAISASTLLSAATYAGWLGIASHA